MPSRSPISPIPPSASDTGDARGEKFQKDDSSVGRRKLRAMLSEEALDVPQSSGRTPRGRLASFKEARRKLWRGRQWWFLI
jgi:hypothetical protein